MSLKHLFLSAVGFVISMIALAQNHELKGTVIDNAGVPVIGASIVVVGGDSSKGMITGLDGKFVFNVSSGATLSISCIGYFTKEVKIGTESDITVVLEEDRELLDEVVVVGYGVQKKVNLTGAVSSVKGDEFTNRPVADVAQALQGLVPGLTVSNSAAGTPGSSTTITLRGQGNLSGSGTPYVLVDGVEMSLSDVNPNDVGSISVLKDAAACAIYGARAAYGVILVTTKKGDPGKARISYQGNVGWTAPTLLPKMVDSYAFARYWNEGVTNTGMTNRKYSDEKLGLLKQFCENPSSVDPWQELPANASMNPAFENSESGIGNTNYFDLHYKDWAFKQRHNLSVSGGTEKSNYYISGGMYNEDGILRFANMGHKRFNVSARTDAQVNKWLKASFSTKFINATTDSPFGDGGLSYGFFHSLARFRPTVHYLDPNGNYTELSMIPYLRSGTFTKRKTNSFEFTAGLQANPLKNLFVNFDYTYRLRAQRYEALNTAPLIYAADGQSTSYGVRDELGITKDGRYTRSNTDINYQTLNLYTNYNLTLASDHNLSFLLGWQEERFDYAYGKNSVTGLYSTTNPNAAMGTGNQVVADDRYAWATMGFFGRVNYDYQGRYLLEVNGRYDGSSRFAADHRWGFFPSVSVGWNIHKEKFMNRASSVLSNLKLRFSYGLLGNQAGAATYTFASTMNLSGGLGGYIFSDGRHSYTNAPGVIDPHTTWEKVTNSNIGLDFGFLGNSLTGSFDIFRRDTRDMLGPGEDYPDFFGASAPQTNNACMRNRGWEFAINYRGSIGRDVHYTVGASVADATAVVTAYENPTGTNPAGNWYVGKSVGEIWGYRSSGLILNKAEADAYNKEYDLSYISSSLWSTGDVILNDKDGNKKIDKGNNVLGDMGDMEIIGNTTPRYNYTFNLQIGWKGLSLSALFQGVGKRDWWPGGSYYFWGWGPFAQVTVFEEHLDYWSESNPGAYYPKPYIHNAGGIGVYNNKNKQVTDRYLQDASYLRLKTLTLSYDLPAKWLEKIGLHKMQVYFTGENLLTFTKLAGMFDPEGIFTYNSYTSEGGKNYPMNKVISFGAVINL